MIYETHNSNDKRKKNWRVSKGASPEAISAKNFRVCEKMFWYYTKIKKAVEEIRAEQSFYKACPPTGGGSSNHAFVSDPTAQAAIKRYEAIKKVVFNADTFAEDVVAYPEKWMHVVEQTLIAFEDNEDCVTKVLYRRYIKNEPMATTCIDLGLTYSKYYRLRDIGIHYARECAIQLGLLRVF